MVYQWTRGSKFSVDPQRVGERLEELRAENAGDVTAELVVRDAQLPSSPLHACFQWDNSKAAREYRRQQARLILRSIVVRIDREGEAREPLVLRAFVNVQRSPDVAPTFVSITEAVETPDLRQQVLTRAQREILQWRRRYAEYREFSRLHSVIDELTLV